MCGFFFAKFRTSENKTSLNNFFEEECNNFIKTRGPSYQEVYKSDSMFIYQSTLAIQSSLIKPNNLGSLGSKQFLLYNGEIYNLKKNKDVSDTEHLYFLAINEILDRELPDMDGMYSICDIKRINNNDILFDAYRDPVGEKHIWYYFGKDIFIVSSVPSIIRKYHNKNSNLHINRNAIEDYLLRRHFISPIEHPISNINILKPGFKLSFRSKQWILTETEFFKYENLFSKDLYVQLDQINQDQYNTKFNQIFANTLESMEFSNAKLKKSSSIISGGYDSSIVSGFLLQKKTDTYLYTMTFGEKDPVSKNVKNILRRKYDYESTKHQIIECDLKKYYKSLSRSIDILSSPVNTHSIPSSYIVAMNAQKDGNSILYGGEGADEIFLGYGCYRYLQDKKASDYNRLLENYSFDRELYQRVSKSKTEIYIKNFKDFFRDYLSSQNVLSEDHLNIKIESLTDIFIQLNNVGLISTDTINSDSGIECRTPFVRMDLLKFAISSPIDKLINFDQKILLEKIPIRNKFVEYFGKESIMPKIGFAGFPNETQAFLGDKKGWKIWEYLDWVNYINEDLSLAEEWKIINLEWFLRIVCD